MFGDLLITLRLPQPARKGGAHRANDSGDGNNVWVGKIRSQVLPPYGATDAVHRLEGSGLRRELKIKSNPPETGRLVIDVEFTDAKLGPELNAPTR